MLVGCAPLENSVPTKLVGLSFASSIPNPSSTGVPRISLGPSVSAQHVITVKKRRPDMLSMVEDVASPGGPFTARYDSRLLSS